VSILDRFCVTTYPWGKKPPLFDDVVKVAQHAEKLGFYSVNLPMVNTLMGPETGGPFALMGNSYTLDALTLLPAMVRGTETIRVAVDSIPLYQLPPFGWAKYFASLDVLSGGRIIVGACLGMGEEAFASVGLRQKDRGRIADEQLEVITRLWTEDDVTHEGEFYKLWGVTLDPKPIQNPHPPIWIGGRTKSIPRTARYGECINSLWPSVEEIRTDYIPRLEAEGAKRGSKIKLGCWLYSRITPDGEMTDAEIDAYFGALMDMEIAVKPSEVTISGSPERCAATIRAYMDAGLDIFTLDFCRHGLDGYETTISQMDAFVEKVVPLLE
jgi:alkanesulfonate monooxygenase SsuD/methylene tetrahydromethanopterin reductase-like flavin-dependent oxidoreductase (luciferase family)